MAGAVHALGKLGIGDGLVSSADRGLGAATLTDMPVDEGHGDIEAVREIDPQIAVEGDAVRKFHGRMRNEGFNSLM